MDMQEKIVTEMRDWCGNPVCVGDTVIFVGTIQPRIFHMFDYIDPELKTLQKMRVVSNLPQFWAWVEAWETEVILVDGVPYINVPKPMRVQGDSVGILTPVNLFWDMYCDQNAFTGNIFAIKDISDDEEKYFRHFFKKGIINQN